MKKLIAALLLSVQILAGCAFAQSAFVVKHIQFHGLDNISPNMAASYLPIKRGQVLRPGQTGDILRSLYQTGFFDHIVLSRTGDTLIIYVAERPIIGELKITGNSVVPTDKLQGVMSSLDIAEGRVYNPAVLEKIRTSLLDQYYQLGRYNARVEVNTAPMSRNRVAVAITISEGLVAKIKNISIIGNHVFSERTLIKQLDVTKTGLFTFFTQTDRYSEEKLDKSLDKLRGYYMDRGYLRVDIKAAQAQISPDRKSVYITIVIIENQPYTIDNYDLKGDLIFPREEYKKYITIKPNQLFSRQKLLDGEKAITTVLGNHGYMFATVNIEPQINDQTHRVYILYQVQPGKRMYVRHITFSNNTRTNDLVLRREIAQMEAAPASTVKLDASKRNLSMLPYIKNVDMNVNPVPGEDNQVDVNYKVDETSSANASFKLGYSQLYGMVLGAGLDQKNFLGTGNTLGVDFSHSVYQQYYGINYTDPYYTEDGISRSFNFAVSRTDPGGVAVTTGYTTNEYDAGVLYSIPVGQQFNAYNRIQAGAAYKNTMVNPTSQQPAQVADYISEHGRRAQQVDFTLGFSHDSRDKAIFPTRGLLQTFYADLYAPLDHDSVTFYQLNYHGKWYLPLNESYIILTRGDFGYGNGLCGFSNCIGNYPLYRNFYAGGIDSVRGFEDYTLGPLNSLGEPLGGNMLVDASVGLIFPNYISDSVRTTLFTDAGNVYDGGNNEAFGGLSTNSGPIRYSVGVEVDWLTPLGPISLSLAKPFLHHGDQSQVFQFALSGNF